MAPKVPEVSLYGRYGGDLELLRTSIGIAKRTETFFSYWNGEILHLQL